MATGSVDLHLRRSIPLFARASEESLQRLAAASSLLDVPPRTILGDENDPVKILHTMVEGAVELLCERAERRFTLCVARGVMPLMLCAVLTGRSPFLARTLEGLVASKRVEVHRTDSLTYKNEIEHELELLESLVVQLKPGAEIARAI